MIKLCRLILALLCILVFSAPSYADSNDSVEIITLRTDPFLISAKLSKISASGAEAELSRLRHNGVQSIQSGTMHAVVLVIRLPLPIGAKVEVRHHILRSKSDPRHAQQKGSFGYTFKLHKDQVTQPIVIVMSSKPVGIGNIETKVYIGRKAIYETSIPLN